MTRKKTCKFFMLLLALVLIEVLVPVVALADEAESENILPEEVVAVIETESPSSLVVPANTEPVDSAAVPEEVSQPSPAELFDDIEPNESAAVPEDESQPSMTAPVDNDGEPLLGTAPPMNKSERPDFKFSWADKLIPELGKEVGQYQVQEGEFYVLQTVLSNGSGNHMTKRLIYVDRVYEAPGILWGTRRTIDYTDADTGEHRTQDISGWSPESVHLFVPETNRIQDKLAG